MLIPRYRCLLEHCIIDILEETGEVPIIIFGDLNARTGDANAREAALPAGGLIDERVDSDSRTRASGGHQKTLL